ncbi:MFS transporter [Azorhizobium oxalatiphilum]|uniref:MFS transporter n=1 Tax=Azorhizobium oxalatiphilum TaxID=980631 RepID=A0A917F8Q1_9HYPH|nr:MDR family MFS transporter [Azorhizobium oxalatiphilum]GGF55914.1 MFS transporter [Azorhizobium oxalatiphilum]
MSAPSSASSPAGVVLSHTEIRAIIFGIMLAMLLAALDQTIVATALPTIGADLHDFENLSWVVTAYLLTSTAVTPLYGKLSDVHGRRAMMLCAISVFSVGSLACALAPNMLTLILARGLQGLGGGGLISLAQTIIADIVSPRERGRYQGMIASVFMASSIGGPVLGGVLAEHAHWSMIFWINLPLGLAAFLMTDRQLRRLPRHDRKAKVDVLGAVLMVTSTVALLLMLTWGGVRYHWDAPEMLALAGAAAIFAVLFVWRIAAAEQPFLPLTILLHPIVSRGTTAALFTMGTLIALSINVPLYFESVRHLTASQSGLGLIPLMGGVVLGSYGSGRALATVTHYKRVAVAGQCAAIAGLLALALGPALPHMALMMVLLGLIGTGIGCLLPIATVSIQNAMPPHLMGTATGAMNFFRSLGAAILVAGFGAVLMAALGIMPGQGDVSRLISGADAERLIHAFRLVFGGAAVSLTLGLCALLSMEERPLRTSARKAAEETAGEDVVIGAAE